MSRTYIAPGCIVLAMMILAISDNFIWRVAESMSVWQYHAMRSAMLVPAIAVVLAILGIAGSIRVQRLRAVLMRSLLSTTALMLYFAAIPAVGISLAAAGLFTSPIFVIVVSVFVFNESVGWRRLLGVSLGFAGVCLVLEIGTQPLRLMAVMPMIGGLLYGLSVIWTRRYCREETPGALAFWNMAVFLALGSVGMLATPWLAEMLEGKSGVEFATTLPRMPSLDTIALVGSLGVAAAVGMVLLAKGYSSVPSSYAALFDYSFLAWVPFFAWVLRGETIATSVAGGIALIIAAGVLAILGANRKGQRDSHSLQI